MPARRGIQGTSLTGDLTHQNGDLTNENGDSTHQILKERAFGMGIMEWFKGKSTRTPPQK